MTVSKKELDIDNCDVITKNDCDLEFKQEIKCELINETKTRKNAKTKAQPSKEVTLGYKTGGKKGTPKAKRKKAVEEKPSHKITEYFPVRRSCRVPESQIKEGKCKALKEAIRKCDESHLRVKEFSNKGRGIVCNHILYRGDFVVEYKGELIDVTEAASREKKYSENTDTGCYMYYFNHANQKYCVDATLESVYLGRLVNHSAKSPNLITKTLQLDGEKNPKLILVAARQIAIGEELLYDYGERNKEAVASNPWLVKT